jgi:hypothetical protein
MKYRKRIAGLEQRQAAYDAIRDPKVKAAQRRPGSLSGSATGPAKGRKRAR